MSLNLATAPVLGFSEAGMLVDVVFCSKVLILLARFPGLGAVGPGPSGAADLAGPDFSFLPGPLLGATTAPDEPAGEHSTVHHETCLQEQLADVNTVLGDIIYYLALLALL